MCPNVICCCCVCWLSYAVVVRTWNFHIWNNGNDQETGRKSQTSQRNTALINGNTFAFDEPHCKCFPHNSNRQGSNHMCLVRQSNPYILQQRWEWTFLKVHNLLNKKTASKFFFTDILARTLRPKEAA